MTQEENETIGRIKWLSPEIKQYNGQDCIGFSMTNHEGFLNIYGDKEKLQKYLDTLKKGYEIKVTIGAGNIVEHLEITSDVVEEQKKKFGYREDPKSKMAGFAVSYTKDLIVAGLVQLKDLEIQATRIHDLLIDLSK